MHIALAAVLFFALGGSAPDAVKADPKHYKVEFENDQLRVLRINYGAGEESVMHSHPEGVAVALSDAVFLFTTPDGKTQELRAKAGEVLPVPGGDHLPKNIGSSPAEVILIEMKKK